MSNQNEWWQIECQASDAEEFAALAMLEGAKGTEIINSEDFYVYADAEPSALVEKLQGFGITAKNIVKIPNINYVQKCEDIWNPVTIGEINLKPVLDSDGPTPNAEAGTIWIIPGNGFGTGHHETTHMMIQHLLEMEIANMKTLDMGCGTAILAILAEMKGAKPIDAIDIDNWCYLNSIENCERNNCSQISVYEGEATLLAGKNYDLIIANINRNILLNDMQTYVDCLNPNGILLLSGFYNEDISFIDASCTEKGLKYDKKFERNNWVSLKYHK
jgi:ribosomal protein L11 methyltransferase